MLHSVAPRLRSRRLLQAALVSAALLAGGTAATSARAQQFTVLHSFRLFAPDGGLNAGGTWPTGQLSVGPDGSLYGVTYGSWGGGGTVFRLDPTRPPSEDGAFTVLWQFCGFDGWIPGGGVVPGPDGYLYGVTEQGGMEWAGVLYRILPAGGPVEVLHEFSLDSGVGPRGLPLVRDGILWGATTWGGPNGTGSVFAYDPLWGAGAVVGLPADPWFAQTWAGLADDGAGGLWGVASQGDPATGSTWGSLYRYDVRTGAVAAGATFIRTANGWPMGAEPVGKLTSDGHGAFYGVTNGGGAASGGVLFCLRPGQPVEVLHDFVRATGYRPAEGLCLAEDGSLLGTTSLGGCRNYGVIFRYRPSTRAYDVLHEFTGLDGQSPDSYATGLVSGGNGVYYGLTRIGGAEGWGAVYSIQLAATQPSPPATTASVSGAPSCGGWYTGPVRVTLTATDPDGLADVAATFYTVDSGSQQTYAGPFAITADGQHTVSFWSVDKEGNQEAPQSLALALDATPPVVTAAVDHATLWPPTGKLIPVTVTGVASDPRSGLNLASATFTVLDEYGLVTPLGRIGVGADGRFSFSVNLQASRRDSDANGRLYTIVISVADNACNPASAAVTVLVPHDRH